jgi:hypothetical protein
MLLTLAWASPAWAQKVTTVPDLTGKQVLIQLANPAVAIPVGEIIAAMTATSLSLAVLLGTRPVDLSSSWILDQPAGAHHHDVRAVVTERALTSGEGAVSAGATFSNTNCDKLSDFSLSALPVGTVTVRASRRARRRQT